MSQTPAERRPGPGPAEAAARPRASFCLANRLSELSVLARQLEAFGRAGGLSRRLVLEINLALEELFTNIVSHGFTDQTEHFVHFDLTCDEERVIIRVEDDAPFFDPLAACSPDLCCSLEQRPVGGLGVHLIRCFMNGLVYERRGERNILMLEKRRPAPGRPEGARHGDH
ncbi:MAG: ATP-binding protein [Thermodesulfobacteriota bacterium]